METTSTRGEIAFRLFEQGYNCSQAVVLAFSDLLPIDRDVLAKTASSFGGGMGRLREVCGAVSGMFAVLGILYGYPGPETGDVKLNHYARVQELAKQFEECSGSIICRELLNLQEKRQSPVPEARTPEYYAARPCGRYIKDAGDMLERYIKEHHINK